METCRGTRYHMVSIKWGLKEIMHDSDLELSEISVYKIDFGFHDTDTNDTNLVVPNLLILFICSFNCSYLQFTTFTMYVIIFYTPYRRVLEYDDCMTCRRATLKQKREHSRYNTKQHLMRKLQLWRSSKCRVPFHCYYSQVHSDQEGLHLLGSHRRAKADQFENYPYEIGILDTI